MARSLQYLVFLALSTTCFPAVSASVIDHKLLPEETCTDQALDDSGSFLQLEAHVRDIISSRSDSRKRPVSGSALGCMEQRWALYSAGKLGRAWPDACFQSVVKGNCFPDADTLSKWMQAPCTCFNPRAPPLAPASNLIYTTIESHRTLLETGDAAINENFARTNGIDGLLDALLAETPNAQVVNLGAGFDGRFYSLASLQKASKLFEIDQEETQALKKALVRQCSLEPLSSGGVGFFTLDSSKTNAYENLFKDPAFDAKQPTFFISEAFFQYLPQKVVRNSLQAVADVLSKNSASRLIIQSWVTTDLSSSTGWDVAGDEVLFKFPANATARKAFYADVGMKSEPTKGEQTVIDAFQQYEAVIQHDEYLDVLASLSSA